MQEMQETGVQALGGEDPLEEGMATHPSVLTWRIPQTEESSRLQSIGSQRVRHRMKYKLLGMTYIDLAGLFSSYISVLNSTIEHSSC